MAKMKRMVSVGGGLEKLLASHQEAGFVLGVSRRTVGNMIARGELPARKIGRRVLVPVDALRKFALQ